MMITYGKLPNHKYMINWPIEGNDYYINLIEMSPEERGKALEYAKHYTMCFVYFLQHELGYNGSVTILGDLTIHANNFATLNKKNFTSATPLKLALNFLILALNDSAFALVSLSSKKLRILS